MSTTLRPAPSITPIPAPAFPRGPQTTRPTPAPATRARARFNDGGWTTPRLLQVFLLASLLLAVLLFVAGINAHNTLRQSVQSVGRDSVPSILAAQQIRASLVDMDANAANDLLAGAGGSRTARDSYDAERTFIGRQVIIASQNITYGNLERIPIETLQDGMTYYTGLIAQSQQQVRDNNQQDAARTTFTQASTYLHTILVPAAERLDAVNTAYLNQAYSAAGNASGWTIVFVVLAGVLLLVALVWAQLFLTQRTRRMLNLPLLVASVVLVVFLANTISTVSTVNADLKTAKRDAFDSIAALSSARALVYDANGDQALAILDPGNMGRYQNQFAQQTTQIADVPVTQAVVDRATRTPNDPGFHGALADELKNITFPGEKNAAIAALAAFGNYQNTNTQIQKFLQMGQRDQAIALATGTGTDQAHRAFEQFDIALVHVININQDAFTGAVNRGFADVSPLLWLSPAAALVIGLLAFFGLQPRLREYAV